MLHRVEVGEAFSNILLHRLAERAGLSDHERALAAELTLGVLRHRARLDRALARFLRYPLDDLTPRIRATLRVGAYQLIFLPRIPHPVAVHETVELARRVGHPGVVKLVNAVLRRLAAEGEPPLPDPAADPIAALAIRHSHPQWLVARWVARWGAEEAKALCAADNETPPSCLRVNMLLTSREAVLEMLRTAGAAAEASPAFDEAIRVRGGATQVRARLADEGKVTVQDEGALAVVRALDPRPGETVIDACAAPGGKTTHIAERMGNRGRVIA
ncbi:MAG: 16S rRNA (cytosine(967)-C(5))-methyltransferase RsmB, partial [Armatimonadetes bacterium]|nr:16S rRNA (cytosine(967)-C(5))-methyltransferase RsmB [Armatimonadota bacterium]